jgi:F-type H+-transporting ATPase subunit gamma
MSKRAQIRRHLGMLDEISGIMGAMRNISLMETHKLARFLAHQHRVLAGIEAAAADFLGHYRGFEFDAAPASSAVIVAVGSQRGFCGDFNESLADAVRAHWRQRDGQPAGVFVVGRRLAAKFAGDARVSASFDGPGVVEEVRPVLERLMNALGEWQSRARPDGLLSVSVFAHRAGEDKVNARSMLPAPPAAGATRHAFPPLLNLAPPAFFSELARHYLWAQMHDVFYGSLMAENRRRLQHMEGAMRRMDEKSVELRRRYNALRQEEITEEIEEIMLGNDALRVARGATSEVPRNR